MSISFSSLVHRHYVLADLIDCWATLLNDEEKFAADDSPKRYFFTTFVMVSI